MKNTSLYFQVQPLPEKCDLYFIIFHCSFFIYIINKKYETLQTY